MSQTKTMGDATSTRLTDREAFPFRLAFVAPLLVAALLLCVDFSALDFQIERYFYTPGAGFVWRNHWFFEDLLHDHAKTVVILFFAGMLLALLLSFRVRALRAWRRELGYTVLAMGLATGIVTPLKALTEVQCPWSLQAFGGVERYSHLLEARAPAQKPGRCWPGGHASTGFSLFALFFALRDRRPVWARRALGLALVLGTVFSLGRMAQGAHFLSHNLWTLLLDWLICLVCYRWLLYRQTATVTVSACRVQLEH